VPLSPSRSPSGTTLVDGTDWCDAWGYCAWAGKTLCGAIPGVQVAELPDSGPDSGVTHGLGESDIEDRDASAMAWGCEGGDEALLYPYGNDLDSTQCFEPGFVGAGPPEPGPVGSTGCEGGFPGLVDMVGVEQWIDSCAADRCVAVGSQQCRGQDDLPATLSPDLYLLVFPRVAFRCCGLEAPSR
jgi:sulfatase modifying factor 1